MAFQLSPGVLVTERDLTSIVPAVSTSIGAAAGLFSWGPANDPTTVTNEVELVTRFGKPNDLTAQSFFTAANFLSYANNLLVTRVSTSAARNAVDVKTGSVTAINITDPGSGYGASRVVTISAPDIAGGIQAEATANINGDGEITGFVIDEAGSGYSTAPGITISDDNGVDFVGTTTISVAGVKIDNSTVYSANYINGNGLVGLFAAKYSGVLGNSIKVSMADSDSYSGWDYEQEFDGAPGTSDYVERLGGSEDELHVIVIDEDGAWTGTAGFILEKFAYVSKASDALNSNGSTNYYKDIVNNSSQYIWWMDHAETDWGTPALNTDYSVISAFTTTLSGGVDGHSAVVDGDYNNAFNLLVNSELYDISLIACGAVSGAVAKNVVENVAEVRKDCVAFVSPIGVSGSNAGAGNIIKDAPIADMVDDIIAFRQHVSFNVASSYGVLDSGYKYQYDRYNDKYRYIPLNGDVAGLCARTDYTNDAWWSPGGFTRGQIKNVVKLAVSPSQAYRDNLYKNGINPVVSFPGNGTVLFGDKTLLAKPSAFDRINVRRLFIVLEKAIATAAKYQLFEFNDSFTRAQFKNLVEPFLRDVQGRRGVIDFRVKCDDTNNTGEVIDRNEFVADIYIKPARSINFITLNFIAARTAVSFEEIGA
jgi:phage tail sheath protein FI